MTQNEAPAARHIPALDGVRGLAIILVLFTHYIRFEPVNQAETWILHTAHVGWTGVDLFFVLSGFLITGILIDSKSSGNYFKSFYARRFLRIFPLYYAFLLFVAFAAPALFSSNPDVVAYGEGRWWSVLYLTNLRDVLVDRGALGHLWSLAVEEQFYLFWPFVVWALSRRALVNLCIGIMIAAPLLRLAVVIGLPLEQGTLAARVLTPLRMDTLALGGLVAAIVRTPHGLERLSRWAAPAMASTGLIMATMFVVNEGMVPTQAVTAIGGLSLLAIFYGGLLVRVLSAPAQSRLVQIFSRRWLMQVGKYSYCMYLIHTLVNEFVQRTILPASAIPEWGGSQLPGQLVTFTASALATFLLAAASWYLFEDHFIRMKRYFPYGSAGQPASVPARSPTLTSPAAAPR